MNISIDNKLSYPVKQQSYFSHFTSNLAETKISFAAKLPDDGNDSLNNIEKNIFELAAGFLLYHVAKPIAKKAYGALMEISKNKNLEKQVKSDVTKGVNNIAQKAKDKDTKTITREAAERVADIISGKASSEELAAAAKESNKKAHEIAAMRQNFPELIANREERRIKFLKNKEKFKNNIFDLDYYKDDFRVNVTVPAERLKILRESDNPKLKEMFNLDRKMFQPEEGIMIYGNNESEKKKLLESFISEAKKYDMDVVYLKAADSDPLELAQKIAKEFPKAKQKFLTQKRQTIFVMEDMDKMLNVKDKTLSTLNAPCRGTINEHTNNCCVDGVMWISTVKDITQLDGSCYRGGRVAQVINIDDAVKLSK